MASPATVYFAGIATVVAAVGIGFGGALIVTDTKPIHKEGPAAFAKRDQPVVVETPTVAPVTTAAVTQPTTPAHTIPVPATTAEKVVALDYAPPQPAAIVQANPVPEPPAVPPKATVAPDATQNTQASAAPPPKKVREPEKVEKKKAPNPVVKSEPRRQYAEQPEPRKFYLEKRRRAPVEVEEDDDSPRVSFASDREPVRRGGDFFSSLFGN